MCVCLVCVSTEVQMTCLFVFGLIPYSMDLEFKTTMWILERQIPHPFLKTMTGEKETSHKLEKEIMDDIIDTIWGKKEPSISSSS